MTSRPTYEPPRIDWWTREEVDAVSATMSSGEGYISAGGGLRSDYEGSPFLYLILAAIVLDLPFDQRVVLPVDHAAIAFGFMRSQVLFYSFATDPAMGLSLVDGCEGRVSTCVSPSEPHDQAYMSMERFAGWGWASSAVLPEEKRGIVECSDLMDCSAESGVKYGPDGNYYRCIEIQLGRHPEALDIYRDIQNYAEKEWKRDRSNPRTYSLLWGNCCDFALECLASSETCPVEVKYDNSMAVEMARGVLNALSPVGLFAGDVDAWLRERIEQYGVPTIPNLVFDEMEGVFAGGIELRVARDEIKHRADSSLPFL